MTEEATETKQTNRRSIVKAEQDIREKIEEEQGIIDRMIQDRDAITNTIECRLERIGGLKDALSVMGASDET